MSRGRRRALLTLGGLGIAAAVLLVLVLSSGSTPPARRPGPTRSSSSAPAGPGTPTGTTVPSPATTPQPALAAPAGEEFGANVNLMFNGHGPPAASIAVQLSALRATGATLARSDAFWEASEPTSPAGARHRFAWAFDDQIAAALAIAGLRWLPVLDYSAPWAQSITGQDHSPPRAAAEYAAYAEAFAARYGPQGTFWTQHPELPQLPVQTFEIWNEPDNGTFWTPQPDAGTYAALYMAARLAIDTVDPAARVVIGGLTKLPRFLPAMLAAMPSLRGHIDGVGVHPYGSPAVALSRVQAARAALRLLGMGDVPLYATEFGWTTQFPGALDYVPAPRRPLYIARTLAELDHGRCGLAAALIYTWYSPEQSPADSQQWYGISGLTGSATPDTKAFTLGLQAAAAPGATPPC